jgi:hypothetical protein
VPTKNHRLPVIAGFRFRCRDKIEPNLQSQNVRRTHPKLMESRFQRDQKLTANRRPVNTIPQISAIFCQEAIPLHSALYLFASRWLLNCKALNKKCYKFVATRKENERRENFLLFCCPSDDDFAEKPRMIRIIKAEFISRPCLDPIGASNTSLCDCEQGLFASVYGHPDFAGISITSAPRDHSFSDSIASRNGIWSGESGRGFGHKDNTRRNKHIFKL